MLPEHVRATSISLLCAMAAAVGGASPAATASQPTLAELIGQKLVVSMARTTPSASLLGRARRGEIGGVIVHRWNFSSPAQLRAITRALQQAAAAGGRPPPPIPPHPGGGPGETNPPPPPPR